MTNAIEADAGTVPMRFNGAGSTMVERADRYCSWTCEKTCNEIKCLSVFPGWISVAGILGFNLENTVIKRGVTMLATSESNDFAGQCKHLLAAR